jgi:membrane protease YdiL (CAAX protease family)
MQTYLKTKPVWMQLLLFLGMAFGLLMVVFMIGGMILSKMTGISLLEMGDVDKWKHNSQTLSMIRGMLLLQFFGMFLIPSLLFAYFSDPRPAQYLGLKPPSKWFYWVAGIAALLVAVPLVEYTGILNRELPFNESTNKWMQSMEDEAAKTIQFMLGKISLDNLIMNIIFIAAFAGIGEELFFRGVLQRLFIRSTKSPWAGIILAAFFFSFFHFQFFGFVPRFFLGILLGAMYWYSGSLWVAILAHFVYDAFFIIYAYFHPQLIADTNASLIDKSYLVIGGLISAVLVATIIWWMKRNSTTSYEAVYAEDSPPPSEKDFTNQHGI